MILKVKTITYYGYKIELLKLGENCVPCFGALVHTDSDGGIIRLLAMNPLGLKCAIKKALM